MLIFDRTRILESIEKPVQVGYTITAEGQPVVGDNTSQVFGVRPAGSLAGEIFYGVAWNQQLSLTALPYLESVIVPTGGGTVNLSRTQLYAGSILALYVGPGGTALTVATTGTPVTGTVVFNLSNGTASFAAGDAGATVYFSYRYAPTVAETNTIQGSTPAGGSAALTLGYTGVIRHGDVYTTEFDTSVDWSQPNPVVRVLNGLFTIGASGAVVPNATVTNVPLTGGVNLDTSVLGIHF